MKDYSVAAIIPCYNAEQFIEQTLRSVLNQTYEHLEIFVIDDGSTDNSMEILENFLPKIKILTHPDKANRGAAASMNLGINSTDCNFIAFLDSDDLWDKNKIKRQIDIFKKHSDIGLVYTNGYAINEKNKILYNLFPEHFYEENIPGRILLNCYISSGPSTVMLRKELLDKYGLFKPNLKYAYDHDMWIRMSEITKFHYIPEPLMSYRRHPSQQSLKRYQWEEGFSVLKDAYKRYPYSLNIVRKRLAVLFYRLGEYDKNNNSYLTGLAYMSLAGLLDPIRSSCMFYHQKRAYAQSSKAPTIQC